MEGDANVKSIGLGMSLQSGAVAAGAAEGVMASATDNGTWDSQEPGQAQEVLATVYQTEGDNQAAAAIRNQVNTEFGLNFIPVEWVTALGKVGTAP